jgi:hypothetical protein
MKENIIAILMGFAFLAIGIMALFFPRRLQKHYLKDFKHHKIAEMLNPFSE